MPDDPAAVTPSKPKPSAALVFGALAGLAFLCLLAGAVLSAVSGIASYSTPAWQYWPWAVGIQRVLFVLLPMACFALSLFGAKRRRTVFLLLALAWQASILLYDIWYLWPPDLAYYLKSLLPLALSAACLLVLFARAEKPAPLTIAGIFAGVLVAHTSLETILYYAISPDWGPEGMIPIFWNTIGLALFAPFYLRRKGAVKRFNIVFLSLAALYEAFFCGMEAFNAVVYAAQGAVEWPEALSMAAHDACIIACMVIALIFSVKAYRASKNTPICDEQVELNIEESAL